MLTDCILLLAPPGVGLDTPRAELANRLNAVEMDVETALTDEPETRALLTRLSIPHSGRISMQTVSDIPRTSVVNLWSNVVRRALARCDSEAEKTGKSKLIVSAHLTYYGGKRSEFYSPVDPKVITGTDATLDPSDPPRNLTHVVLLIDDVFDMYARLRAPKEIYADKKVVSFLGRIFNQAQMAPADAPELEVAKLTLGWQVRTILHLLAWRGQEILLAESLAHTRGLAANRVLVWAVKQSTSALAHWLADEMRPLVYMSHPITEARSQRRRGEPWPPDFVDQGVNKLQSEFDALGVTLVAPTGIDELRFATRSLNTTGLLEARWPLPEPPTFYVKPSYTNDTAEAPDYDDLLRPRRTTDGHLIKSPVNESDAPWISASLQALVREVEAQVAARDLFLVYHTDGVLVYRPLYTVGAARPTFSAGVLAEVELWSQLCTVDVQRQLAVIHLLSEVRGLAQKRASQNLRNLGVFFQRALHIQFKGGVLPSEVVEDALRNQGEFVEVEQLLRSYSINSSTSQDMTDFIKSHWQDMKERLLEDYLVGDVLSVGYEDSKKTELLRRCCAIWVVDDTTGITVATYREVGDFLKTGTPKGSDWQRLTSELIPDPS